MKYCAYQERCVFEVQTKLRDLGINRLTTEEIIDELIDDNFIDEKRFVCSFVRGRYKYKKWGRLLITNKLKEKRIKGKLINIGLAEIEEKLYLNNLKELALRKWKGVSEQKPEWKIKKTHTYLLNKGYENHLIWEIINKIKG